MQILIQFVQEMHLIPPGSSTEEIVHAADIDRVEKQILDLALARTASSNGAIFLWKQADHVLRIDFHVVDGQEFALPEVLIERRTDGRPEGVAFYVAENNVPYLTNDTSTCPYYAGYFLEVRSIAAVPIPYQDRAIGVISVSSPEKDAFSPEHLVELEALAASSATFLRRAQLYRQGRREGKRPVLIKGLSPEWLEVERLIERISPSGAPVLIRGESGTGKELVANAIRFNSRRADRPFVSINCAAIPEQLLESMLFGHVRGAFTGADYAKVGELKKADGGTLFLDELGELTPALQAKVLRALELGEVVPLGSNDPPETVDVRLLAATNRDLEAMRAVGQFRDDLYFRLAVVTIWLPPLRSYRQNLDVLCQTLIEQANASYHKDIRGISPEALARLRSYDFPGNIRELRNLVDHGVLMATGTMIEADDLPTLASAKRPAARTSASAPRKTLAQMRREWVGQCERSYLRETLVAVEGDIGAAAGALGIDRTTLYRLLKKHGLRLERRVR